MPSFFSICGTEAFFEVIIIDDSSTDNSYDKLMKYEKETSIDLKVFKTKENCGPGGARNIGIKNATGKYVTFVDNDDWIDCNLLEMINSIISKKEYDCIIYDYSMDFENKKSISCSSMYGDFENEVEKKDAIRYVRNHSVCKFYKNKILKENDLVYPEIRRHEDIAFVGSALIKCESFFYLKQPLYHYVQIKKSLSRNNKLDYKYFYSYTTDICMLLYEVTKNDSGQFVVVERREDQPNLFRDFPLIGSEKFHFPFFLDGFKFNPLETRNGLYLNGELNEEAIENRKIITEAIKSSINFTKWLLEENIDKRYLLAKSNIPEPPQRYDTIAIDWFIQQQKNWRAKLAELRLIKNKKGNYNKLKLLKLPIFKEKFNIEFFKLFTELNVTEANIPIVEEAEIWYKILEDDPLKKVYDKNENTWNFSYAFTEIDLLRKIKGFGTIQEFASKMVTDTKSVISWLNRLCNFFQKNDCMNYICEYEIIPNKNGKFI